MNRSGASTVPGAGEAQDPRTPAWAALRAAMRGEFWQADLLLAEVERGAPGPGHALDRALVHLTRATMFALDGAAAAANAELICALHAAASERIDPGVVMEAIRELGDVIVVADTGHRRLAWSSSLALPADAVVLDTRSDELRLRDEVRSLRRYPERRRLLYVLARHPGRVHGTDALVEAVWGCAYDPLRHDDALEVDVLHLRRMLAGSGVAIVCGHPGYRLEAARPFVCVSAFELGCASSPRCTDTVA
jgi:hypothetical protein